MSDFFSSAEDRRSVPLGLVLEIVSLILFCLTPYGVGHGVAPIGLVMFFGPFFHTLSMEAALGVYGIGALALGALPGRRGLRCATSILACLSWLAGAVLAWSQNLPLDPTDVTMILSFISPIAVVTIRVVQFCALPRSEQQFSLQDVFMLFGSTAIYLGGVVPLMMKTP